jgi:ppGpp synthetase/RelA/SpoT-type nucleotidyltranferase
MNKLFQTLFVLFTISSQSHATPVKPVKIIDESKLLPFSQSSFQRSYAKNLQGLYSIESFQAVDIKQPYNDFNLLYRHAMSGQSELENLTKFMALATGTQALSSGVKSEERAFHKINSKFAGHSDRITDLARTSIVSSDVSALVRVFELLEQQTEILRVKNRFKTPAASGYRDLSLLVRLPDSKIIAEVQLHLEAFSEIKNGVEHHNYEQIQRIERKKITESRELNDIEVATIAKLRKESLQMYHGAWNQYLSA